MKKLLTLLAAGALIPLSASATPITIVDTTGTGATNDGTIGGSEYVGSSSGINTGFGDVIGAASSLHVDSDNLGGLFFGIARGPAVNFNDVGVIYIDSVAGGFSDLVALNDNSSRFDAAISGDGEFGDFSDMTFATGFQADYAIAFDSGGAELFLLVNSGAHTSLGALTYNSSGSSLEFDTTLGNIGLGVGGSFDYVATYINSGNAFRSDEFHGVAASTAASGNIGSNGNPGGGGGSIALANGDFNTFVSIPEPNTALLLGIGLGAVLLRRMRR